MRGRALLFSGIVSLNLCTDDLLVRLAPERIAALSPLARDASISVVADEARHLPWVRPVAEAVLALHPDLVLAGPYGAQTVLPLIESRGVPVWRTTLPSDFAGIRDELLRLGDVLGAAPRARALADDMDARLAALPKAVGPVRALVLGARGYTAGPGSLDDAVLNAAGLSDAGDGRQVTIETVLRLRPDILVVAPEAAYPSLATDFADHPALRAIRRVAVPSSLTICAGPWSVEAAEILAR